MRWIKQPRRSLPCFLLLWIQTFPRSRNPEVRHGSASGRNSLATEFLIDRFLTWKWRRWLCECERLLTASYFILMVKLVVLFFIKSVFIFCYYSVNISFKEHEKSNAREKEGHIEVFIVLVNVQCSHWIFVYCSWFFCIVWSNKVELLPPSFK